MSKNVLVGLVIILFFSVGAFFAYNAATQDKITTGEIKSGMVLKNAHVISLDSAKVTVGDVHSDDPIKPQVTLSKWDDKHYLSLSYPISAKSTISEANKITWRDDEQEVYFKKITDKGILQNKYDEKYEFDITLKEKPTTNVFTYAIDTNNLDFVYQPIQKTSQPIESTVNNKKRIIQTSSLVSENIQGSYTVYRKVGKTATTGSYYADKAFQIYRPKIIASDNKWVWGELNIDSSTGKLTVTVDSAFLASAKYPVVIDPTIGITYDSAHAVVTSVGRLRWKLAVEYEIRDDTGKLLGSDVVIIDVRPGETSADIFGFLEDYLRQRAAVWVLAQGNYKLKEMSNDRLTSSHFQKEDNGDEVDDQYSPARQARKQVLDTITQQALPTFSITYNEADILQRPEVIEVAGVGRNSVPTGNIVRGSETFQVGNELIGAGTEILRPNGVGDQTLCDTYFPVSVGHWDKVDEVSTDDDTTYVQNGTGTDNYAEDDYALQNTALTTETISSIDVTHRIRNVNGSAGAYAGIRRSGTNTLGPFRAPPGSYTNYTESSLARPGGGSWAVSDLDALQVVTKLLGDDQDAPVFVNRLTQIYVTVNYTAVSSVPININRGTNFIRGVNIR